MNIAFALDYIPRRMEELGYGDQYLTRYLNVRIPKASTISIPIYNQLLFLITPETNVRIESSRGVFDAEDSGINIQQHEHSGRTLITNKGFSDVLFLIIQVIPLNTKKKNSHA